ncbi:MAG: hypothetical protein KA239_07470 [Bacteroidia bacterium]|nr:hypothetical protein [Bacteroidia bacterium]
MRLGFFLFLAVCWMAIPLRAGCVNNAVVASFSEQIGEVASMAAVKGMVPSAEKLPSALPGDAELLQTAVRFREAINEDRFVYMLANQKIDENGSIESNILLNQFENERSTDESDPS